MRRFHPTRLGSGLLTGLVILVAMPRDGVDDALLGTAIAVVIGVTLVGAVVPVWAVRRIEVEARSPGSATVGDDLPIAVEVRRAGGGADVRVLDPTGGWHHVDGTSAGELVHRADVRGSFPLLRLELRVTAPLGVFAAHRVVWIVLPELVDVGPRPAEVEVDDAVAPRAGSGDPRPTATLAGDVVRSVRPYVSGDPAHLVHWPSSARSGTLVVREMEPPGHVRLAVVVDLSDLGLEQEAAASFACGVGRRVLDSGGELHLSTCEAAGPVAARVPDRPALGRRLARAVPGTPAAAPDGWPTLDVRRWWRDRTSWDAGASPAGNPTAAVRAPAGVGTDGPATMAAPGRPR